jgi:branched-chain amino acid transport system ATP-binding protein
VSALEIVGLRKVFGGVVALDGVDLSIDLNQIVGIIGPNGSGKTTLFNVITGAHKPTAGNIRWQNEEITGKSTYQIARRGLMRTFQQAMSSPGLTVRENVLTAFEQGCSKARTAETKWSSPEEILSFVGLVDLGKELAGSMPFGNLRRLGIAIALAARPVLLLLDEPAAGLSDSEVETLAELILRLPQIGTHICLIDHDMFLMSALCQRLIVLNFGTKIAEGPPDLVLKDPKVTEVYLGNEL